MRQHVLHHVRFYVSGLIGIGAWFGLGPFGLEAWLRFAAAGDVFFAVYLVSTSVLALHATPDELRQHARYEDEGVAVIFLLTVSAFALCAVSIIQLLSQPGAPNPRQLMLAIASVPLGWLTLHTIMAFRYAHLFYARTHRDGQPRDAEGLAFPGTPEPAASDFLYYSFVVGMTAQVSDVQVTTARMRRATLLHGVTSFFYNTVLVALAVNVAAGYGGH